MDASAQPPTPDEGVLPGQQRPAAPRPDEAVLPGENAEAAHDLPGEDRLPGPRGAEAEANELAPVAGSAPILRLAFPGHTGLIRTIDLADGGRTLISGGEDKDLHVWRRTDLGNTGWLHRRAVRWPVTRGPRGRIYAATLNNDLVAFAGHGAFGSNGEIRIVDVASGDTLQTLVDANKGHRSVILAMAWSPREEPQLASLDMQGQVMLWEADPTTGIWRGRKLVDEDPVTYGDAIAAQLRQSDRRAFGDLCFLGTDYLVVPRLAPEINREDGFLVWHLQRIDLRTGESVLFKNFDHLRCVRRLQATADGRTMVSSHWNGQFGVWRLSEKGTVAGFHELDPGKPLLSLDVDASGERLLVGTERGGDNGLALLQLWDMQTNPPKKISELSVNDHIFDVALDREQQEAIITQNNRLELFPISPQGRFINARPIVLEAPAKPVLNVAFEKGDAYRIGFGWHRDDQGNKTLDGVFDLSQSKLLAQQSIDPADFLAPQRMPNRWSPGGPLPDGSYRLYEDGQPRGILPLNLYRHGVPTAACTLPHPAIPDSASEQLDESQSASRNNGSAETQNAPGLVFVGTQGQNGIYAYLADEANPPVLIRQFRDHSGAIHSLSTSADGKYLVSGSADAMISVWNLQEIWSLPRIVNRWGADFAIENNKLIATTVREDGPLYFRGVRSGDQLVSIQWYDSNRQLQAESDPARMRQRLLDLPFDTLLSFKYWRLNRPGPEFQSYPAWRPLATLFVDQTREWAYWTPAGYYDASFNGHQKFGWQLNPRNVDGEVRYYRAAQFRKMLERPVLMRKLLKQGSLPAAVRETVTGIGPPPAEGAIVNQIESKPEIRLLSPDPGQVVQGGQLTVRAEIDVPTGATLIEPKAFISGVPAIERRSVPNREQATEGTQTFEWFFRLPSDRNLQLEILGATESEALGRLLVDLSHDPGDQPRRTPRLHVLAIGVGDYADPQIQSLDFAADAARRVSELFRDKASTLYQTSSDQLVDRDATRPLWRVFAQSAAEKLQRTVSPDDLVIMYLCGHGLRDRRTDQWYFVTSDARYNDLMNDRYDDCLAFSDLAMLSRLPCRKLAILDSCHSGAVQPVMRRDDLKSALRFLQDDVVITLTASEGDEEASEQRETQLGRFTTALVDALQGAAEEIDDDTTISLQEVIHYVTDRVSRESEAEQMPQHPTASPEYLLRTLQLPLTSR